MFKLRVYPDEILTTPSSKVTIFDEVLNAKVEGMIKLMKEEKGLGLAAQQAGLLDSIFVMQVSKNQTMEFINPIIVSESLESQFHPEACLSDPSRTQYVFRRPKSITLRWQDRKGVFYSAVFHDIGALCILHEMDHLSGIVVQTKESPDNPTDFSI